MLFRQLFDAESSTYSYLLADEASREAVLIDPVLEQVDRDLAVLSELGLKLVYVCDTHIHADHVTAAGELRRLTGARTAVSARASVGAADVALRDGQEIRFGSHALRTLETPGHTESCLSFAIADLVFTGDTLLIEGTGRTDFQQGSAGQLYESITKKLFTLPDETKVYPGHDYKGRSHSSIGAEKAKNPRVGGGKTKAEFIELMQNLKLAQPKKILEAVPANLGGGTLRNLKTSL